MIENEQSPTGCVFPNCSADQTAWLVVELNYNRGKE